MADVLTRICNDKRDEIARARAVRPTVEVSDAPTPRTPDFGEFGVVAEVKRASPSAGTIAAAADAVLLAQRYASAGAAAISVLTDGPHFGGSLADLVAVREAVDVPVLRKDFIVDPYQVDEARAAGADIVLVIVAAVDAATLAELTHRIRTLGMTPLIEVHDVAEVPDALRALRFADRWTGILGVNARNLQTLDVDLGVWEAIASEIPAGVTRIAESGVAGPADAVRAFRAGYQGVLCGEALMRADDPACLIAELRRGGSESAEI